MINKTNNIIYSIYTDCEGKVKGRVKYCSDPPPRALTFYPSHGPFKYVLSSSALLYSALPCPALPCLALLCSVVFCLSHPKFPTFTSSTLSSSYYQSCVIPLIFLFSFLSFPTVYILSLFLERRVPIIVLIITLYSLSST